MKIDKGQLSRSLRKTIPHRVMLENIVFVCIGTDRSTGDALGPVVGTYLTNLGYTNVIGTLDDPCHAVSLQEKINLIAEGKTVIAIDACLGHESSIGEIRVNKGPVKPGAGVNKDLPPVGDYSITGIVNVGGFMEYFVLQNTRLSLVMEMARSVVDAITSVFPTNTISQVAVSEVSTCQE